MVMFSTTMQMGSGTNPPRENLFLSSIQPLEKSISRSKVHDILYIYPFSPTQSKFTFNPANYKWDKSYAADKFISTIWSINLTKDQKWYDVSYWSDGQKYTSVWCETNRLVYVGQIPLYKFCSSKLNTYLDFTVFFMSLKKKIDIMLILLFYFFTIWNINSF